eukprot:11452060-Karenia_brevis.AAC.1
MSGLMCPNLQHIRLCAQTPLPEISKEFDFQPFATNVFQQRERYPHSTSLWGDPDFCSQHYAGTNLRSAASTSHLCCKQSFQHISMYVFGIALSSLPVPICTCVYLCRASLADTTHAMVLRWSLHARCFHRWDRWKKT